MIIEGSISVKAAVKNHKRKIEKILIDENKHDKDFNYIRFRAKEEEIELTELKREELDKYNITLNKNCIPNDSRSPIETSGLRIGTPAMTTKGWTSVEFRECARRIDQIIKELDKRKNLKKE